MELIHSKIITASKHHPCDACFTFYRNGLGSEEFSSDDQAIIESAIDGFGRINPGEKYLRQVVKIDGYIFTVRARLDMDMICKKYGLYEVD